MRLVRRLISFVEVDNRGIANASIAGMINPWVARAVKPPRRVDAWSRSMRPRSGRRRGPVMWAAGTWSGRPAYVWNGAGGLARRRSPGRRGRRAPLGAREGTPPAPASPGLSDTGSRSSLGRDVGMNGRMSVSPAELGRPPRLPKRCGPRVWGGGRGVSRSRSIGAMRGRLIGTAGAKGTVGPRGSGFAVFALCEDLVRIGRDPQSGRRRG